MTTTVEVVTHGLNVRTGPSTGYSVSHGLAEKQQAVTDDSFAYDKWLHITAPFDGYISTGTQAKPLVRPVSISIPTPPAPGDFLVQAITDLNIRSKPSVDNNTPLTYVKAGTILHAESVKDGWYKLAGVQQYVSADSRYSKIVTTAPVPTPTPLPTITGKLWGINTDPRNGAANPPAAALSGVGWVRFVFSVVSNGKVATLDETFNFYDPIIRSLVAQGTKVLLVLLQDTYWGNGPWDNGNWPSFTLGFAAVAGKIAQHYKGLVAAYEVWNEMDISGQPTSIFISPEIYATLLVATSKAIKQSDAGAKVISGGLAGGDPISYMNKVRVTIGNLSCIDAIAYHPYGQTPPNTAVFDWLPRYTLGKSLQTMYNAFGLPVWITEIGVARVDVNNESFWPTIGNYMRQTFLFIRNTLTNICPVLIWFAWADSQDRAGIVHDNQQHKGAIFDAFTQNVRGDTPTVITPPPTPPPTQPTPPPKPPTTTPKKRVSSVFSFQVVGEAGNNTPRLLQLIANMRAAKKPLNSIKLTKNGWDSQLTCAKCKEFDPDIELTVRRYDADWEDRVNRFSKQGSFPDGWWNQADMRQIGYDWMMDYNRLYIEGEPDTKLAKYHQIICEPDYGRGTASFWMGVMDAADKLKINLVLLCFGSGRPALTHEGKEDSYIWASLYDVLRRGKARGDVLGMDAYVNKQNPDNWTEPYEIQRWKDIYADFPADLKDMRLYFLEYGDEKSLKRDIEHFIENLGKAEAVLDTGPCDEAYLWTVGDGGDLDWSQDRIDAAFDQIEDYLKRYSPK